MNTMQEISPLITDKLAHSTSFKSSSLLKSFALAIATLAFSGCGSNIDDKPPIYRLFIPKEMSEEEKQKLTEESDKYLNNPIAPNMVLNALQIREKKWFDETYLVIANTDYKQRVEIRITGNTFNFSIKGSGKFTCEILKNRIVISPEDKINDKAKIAIVLALKDFNKTMRQMNEGKRPHLLETMRGETELWLTSRQTWIEFDPKYFENSNQ